MVKSNDSLSSVYFALSDPTRRGILAHVSTAEMSIGDIVDRFKLSFAAISKHITVLEHANLITKKRRGKEKIITFLPDTMTNAQLDIEQYKALWESRLDTLDKILKEEK